MKQKKFWVLAGILLGAVILSLCIGRYPLTLRNLWDIVTGIEKGMGERVFLADPPAQDFFGSGLRGSLIGFRHGLPAHIRNPLVSPDVLGVTSGASVGAAMAILLGGTAAFVGLSAFAAGLAAAFLTLALAKAVGGQPEGFSLDFRYCDRGYGRSGTDAD